MANNPLPLQIKYNLRYARWHRWVFSILMIVGFIIILLSADLLPKFFHYQMVKYGDIKTLQSEGAYCPGDELRFTVELEKRNRGPINIREQWCRVEGNCAVSMAVEWPSYIDEEQSNRTYNGERTIPYIRTMAAGQRWRLIHSSFPPGHPEYDDSYRVFFTLADDCEAWQE